MPRSTARVRKGPKAEAPLCDTRAIGPPALITNRLPAWSLRPTSTARSEAVLLHRLPHMVPDPPVVTSQKYGNSMSSSGPVVTRFFVDDDYRVISNAFEVGAVKLTTRLIEGEFPNVLNLIPASFPAEAVSKFGKNTLFGHPGQPNEVAPSLLFRNLVSCPRDIPTL